MKIERKALNSAVMGGIAVGSMVILTACAPAEDHNEQAVNSSVSNALNADASNAAQLLSELQKQDPSIIDVHFKGDPSNRMIVVARKTGTGEVVTTEIPYATVQAAVPATQQATDGSSGFGTMLMSGAIGAMAGYMMANALTPNRSNWSSPMSSSSYSQERERNRSSYIGSAASTYRSSYVSNMRSGNIARSAGSSNSAPKAAPNSVGKSSGGSFASSGARAGGYSGGGSGG